MTDATTLNPFEYFKRHEFALFPIPAGSKNPTGIITHFSREWSRDASAWSAWRAAHPACNFGIVAGPSQLIIVDVDVSEVGREVAWKYWTEWCRARNLPVYAPQFQSARQGWHIAFRIPPDFPAATLRQVPLVSTVPGVSKKPIIDLRVGNGFVVAAGSTFLDPAGNSLPYVQLSAEPPYPAPEALLAACGRARTSATATPAGRADMADTKRVLEWMAEHGSFASYDRWFQCGMLLKSEFGDDPGFSLWQITNDGTVTVEQEKSKWESFSAGADPNGVKIGTLRSWAKQDNCPHNIGSSVAAMFGDTVAQLAANTGATLSSDPTGNALIGQTQKVISSRGDGHLTRFLEATYAVPSNPSNPNYPRLPENFEALYPSIYDKMCEAIRRIVVMTGTPRTFNQRRVMYVLGVLHHMHAPTCKLLVEYIHTADCPLSLDNVIAASKKFEVEVNNDLNGGRTAFYTGKDSKPDPAISNNVGIFLTLSNHRTQFDRFGRRTEVACNDEPFRNFDQDELDRLWMLAKSVDYNYHPARDLFKTGVKVEAQANEYDSLEDEVLRLSNLWDGVPRLDSWLTKVCHVADDELHRTIGRNLIGGMVKRARAPDKGVKHDEIVIFISPKQGTGKSTIANILARNEEWFLDKFKFGQSDQSSLPLLAGKWVVELGELAGFNKAASEDVKSFLSAKVDSYVAKYEVLPTENPRRCIFIGTSNLRQPLADPSGNRRFLPVHVVGHADLDWLRKHVDHLIGEAARRHADGESFDIPEPMWETLATAQEQARSKTAVEETIQDWFDRPEGSFYVVAADIQQALKNAGLNANSRYGVFMEKLGWRDILPTIDGKRTRVWIKHYNNRLHECLSLIPSQAHANGRVEMRIRPGVSAQPPVPSRE